MYTKITDLTGNRYGKLLVLGLAKERIKGKVTWTCKCDCGNTIDIIGVYLTKEKGTKSCGCICKKHGMFGTRIYNLWHTMKERCYVPTCTSYPNYGARGIKVCPEWQEFIPFMEWAYANGYDENAPRGQCTLDRIDPNGDYCPDNCRWVSMSVQANNKTDNVYLEYNGVRDTLTNHARKAGISPVLAEGRYLSGKSSEDIFKPAKQPNTIKYKGSEYTIMELSKILGISRSVVYKRIFCQKENVDFVASDVKSKKRKPIVKNRKVIQYDKNMNFLKEWDNLSQIEKEIGFNKNAIGNCCIGNSKTSFGYIWKYK